MRARPLPSERRRVAVCGAFGILVGALAALLLPWQLAVLIGWLAAAVAFIVTVWVEIRGFDAERTRLLATREDDSRTAASVLMIVAAIGSLAGVAFGIAHARSAPTGLEIALGSCGMSAIIAAWAVIHVVYVLRYAHLYYTEPEGGIDFPGGEAPSYVDFAYFAFTVGMTFQVSDTQVTARSIRVTVLRHGLLSYLFATAIVAVAINLVAGFVR